MLEQNNWDRVDKTLYEFQQEDHDFQALTRCFFTVDPTQRPSASQLLNHTFFRK